jgi:hypothetical protein
MIVEYLRLARLESPCLTSPRSNETCLKIASHRVDYSCMPVEWIRGQELNHRHYLCQALTWEAGNGCLLEETKRLRVQMWVNKYQKKIRIPLRKIFTSLSPIAFG